MSRLFVFTAINDEAVQHLDDSIINPIDNLIIDQNLDKTEINKYDNGGTGVFAWGAVPGDRPIKPNIGRWKKMNSGDYILTVCKKNNYQNYRFVSQIIEKLRDAQFAETIWGRDDKDQTWEYMYFLTPPKEIDVKVSSLENLLKSRYQGFHRCGDETNVKIINKYGSIEDFIKEEFQYSSTSNGVTQSSQESLEQKLHQELLSLFDRAKEIDYRPTRYLQAVRRKGGLAYAKDKLSSKASGQTTGLNKVLEAGRPDLTLEYTILQPQFRSLFTDEEINIAKERLKDFEEAVEIQNEINEEDKSTFNQSDYEKLISELANEGSLDNPTVGTSRKEQKHLRKYLFGKDNFNKCGICSHKYHVDMLVAAHIKKRAKCTKTECLDYKNIVMPMCKMGCDDLYEKGYIYIENGKVIKNQDRVHDLTSKMSSFIQSFEERGCPYYNDQTKKYFDWHRSQFVKDIIKFNEGDEIKHNTFGKGKIIAISGNGVQKLSIKFNDQETRTIMSNLANLKLIV